MRSQVVDPASIAVSRRNRRAKTDRIDAEGLLRTLMAFARGERQVCAMVRPPTPEAEDAWRHASEDQERERSPTPPAGSTHQSRAHPTLLAPWR